MTDHPASPVFKWAGGKTQIIPELIKYLPPGIETGELTTYIEPFVGGGSFFLYLTQQYPFKKIYINDTNKEIILVYQTIKNNTDPLIQELSELESVYRKKSQSEREQYYYRIRDEFNNNLSSGVPRAAQTIFLNRTCYNGLWRVNQSGHFNVPCGKYKNPTILNEKNLIKVSEILKHVKIQQGDFTLCAKYADEKLFVYFDPPYRPLITSSFTSYSKEGFSEQDQIRLTRFIKKLDKKGAKIMMSNSENQDTFFETHLPGYRIKKVPAKRIINCKSAGRGEINELIITNYPIT